MLLFKKKFLDAIRCGDKTQTIRLWPYCRMRAGQRSYIPGVGYIRIDTIDQVSVDALSDADARRDGFTSAGALRTELNDLYAEKIAEGHQAYRIIFAVLPPEEQRRLKQKKARRKQQAASSPK